MSQPDEKFTRQTITDILPLTPSLFSFRCTRDDSFRFTAGQFARLGVRTERGNLVWRAYSMVSSPFDEFLDFFSIVVPDGEFTSVLSQLKIGDELLIEKQPQGFLTLDRFVDGRDLWMLATGTGVAPFLSILQDFSVWERFERIVLVYSVRTEVELAYQDLLQELLSREYIAPYAHKLRFVPVVTREPAEGRLSQRITESLVNGQLEQAADLAITPEYSRILICGNPEMVDETRKLLKQRDLQLSLTRRPGQVAVENYW